MTAPVTAAMIALADELAEAAAAIARRYFRTPVTVDTKADASPVSIADREAERAMRALIEARFPDHGIWGEEFGRVREGADFVWVLDPIDGTKAFLAGKPTFGVLVGLVWRNRPVYGVIEQPHLRERWAGGAGHATTLNGQPVRTRLCPALAQATLFATSPEMFGANLPAFERVRSRVRYPVWGCDCYAFGLVASGFADLAIEAGLSAYDWCALVPVVEAAGGVITDWQGQPLTPDSDGRVVAAGDSHLHGEVLRLLADG
ncbi:MAG: histidinol-phosphatase [Alphaproteobacteria bacterium]|nr:histidinol-phosphatase [Alphaproteobacteria bacterium]